MAIESKATATLSFIDGVLRPCEMTFNVSIGDAQTWLAAGEGAPRAATDVGQLFAAAIAMTSASLVKKTVSIAEVETVVANPDDDVLRGNKLQVSYRAGIRNYSVTIPARNPASYTQSADSLQCLLDDPAAMDLFVQEFGQTALGVDGDAAAIQRVTVVD